MKIFLSITIILAAACLHGADYVKFSHWSPLAMLGNWQGVDNYGTLVFLPEKK